MQFNYQLIGIAAYGNTRAIHAELGAIFHLTEDLHTGLHVYNLFNSKLISETGRKLPAVYSAGTGYELSDVLFISAEMAKVEGQPANLNIGLHYAPVKQLLIRGGISTAYNQVFLGTGVKWKDTRIDVTASYHPKLGITPSLLFIFTRQREEE